MSREQTRAEEPSQMQKNRARRDSNPGHPRDRREY